mmetsp:Transcript_19037/g.51142  ORF Transcript_19037/g.51142 Transcript_19037/m.51142 type:complete len:170 (-) Transcript_19037:178-687(-)
MKILDNAAGALTNFEVYTLIKEDVRKVATERQLINGARRTQPSSLAARSARELQDLRATVVKCLQSTVAATQSAESVREFHQRVKGMGLTPFEILHLLNHRPTEEVHVFLMVDCCGERLTEGQVHEILQAVRDLFPAPTTHATEDGNGDDPATESAAVAPNGNGSGALR